jgi:hypothetical protein
MHVLRILLLVMTTGVLVPGGSSPSWISTDTRSTRSRIFELSVATALIGSG